MSALLSAYALILAARHRAPVTLNVNAASGDTISGLKSFRVTVMSDNPVTQVEFYVGSDLRDNATATPYLFNLDTIDEADGKIRLRFKAYTTEGETGEKTIVLNVDNGLAKGPQAHIDAGLNFLTMSDWPHAEAQGRIALKLDANSNPARIVLTRAYLGEQVYDKAQKYAEDAVTQDPKDVAALNLLATVDIKRAFSIVARAGQDPKEVAAAQRDALKSAVERRRQALDIQLSGFTSITDKNRKDYADLAIEAARYSLVDQALRDAFLAGSTDPAILDRLAFAQMRRARFDDALDTLDKGRKANTLDASGYAIGAVCLAELNRVEDSVADLQKAESLQSDNPTVRTAQAYIALKFVRSDIGEKPSYSLYNEDGGKKSAATMAKARASFQTLLSRLQGDLGHRPETNYFVESLDNKIDEYEAARKAFETAILFEPVNPDVYIEEANRSLALSFKDKPTETQKNAYFDSAETMFQTALTAAPSSAAALSGLCILEVLRDHPDLAVKWGEAAIAADKNYAAGYVALSAAYNLQAGEERRKADGRRNKNADLTLSADAKLANELAAEESEKAATKLNELTKTMGDKAGQLDGRIQGFDLSNPKSAWQYYNSGGRIPIVVPPR